MPRIDVDEGHIHYEMAGSGPLLLIYPGNTSGAAHHAGDLAYFSDRFTVATFDYIGYGQSTRMPSFPSDFYSRNAGHGATLCRHLGFDALIALGVSGGGIAALYTAILFPDLMRAVIADSTPADFPPERAKAVRLDRALRTPGQIAFWKAAHGKDWESVVDSDTELVRRLAASHGDTLFAGRLGEIRCPTLITASHDDTAIGEPGQALVHLVGAIPASRGILFAAGGHPTMWLQAAEFRRQADQFLADVLGA